MTTSRNKREGNVPDLILPVKRRWFEDIAAGIKPEEFRERTEYWRRRLEGRTFSRVIVTLGYPSKDDASRRLIFPWQGYREIELVHEFFGNVPTPVFAIKLYAPDSQKKD